MSPVRRGYGSNNQGLEDDGEVIIVEMVETGEHSSEESPPPFQNRRTASALCSSVLRNCPQAVGIVAGFIVGVIGFMLIDGHYLPGGQQVRLGEIVIALGLLVIIIGICLSICCCDPDLCPRDKPTEQPSANVDRRNNKQSSAPDTQQPPTSSTSLLSTFHGPSTPSGYGACN